ncbi:hypothetical protein H6G36_00690 [Anabaena minutissima FACHB-250]|nr:hypothetical protein [Anabaena minutissima FACHB-250]
MKREGVGGAGGAGKAGEAGGVEEKNSLLITHYSLLLTHHSLLLTHHSALSTQHSLLIQTVTKHWQVNACTTYFEPRPRNW